MSDEEYAKILAAQLVEVAAAMPGPSLKARMRAIRKLLGGVSKKEAERILFEKVHLPIARGIISDMRAKFGEEWLEEAKREAAKRR